MGGWHCVEHLRTVFLARSDAHFAPTLSRPACRRLRLCSEYGGLRAWQRAASLLSRPAMPSARLLVTWAHTRALVHTSAHRSAIDADGFFFRGQGTAVSVRRCLRAVRVPCRTRGGHRIHLIGRQVPGESHVRRSIVIARRWRRRLHCAILCDRSAAGGYTALSCAIAVPPCSSHILAHLTQACAGALALAANIRCRAGRLPCGASGIDTRLRRAVRVGGCARAMLRVDPRGAVAQPALVCPRVRDQRSRIVAVRDGRWRAAPAAAPAGGTDRAPRSALARMRRRSALCRAVHRLAATRVRGRRCE